MDTVNLLMPTRYLVNSNLKFPQMMNDQKVFWKHLDKRKEMRLGGGGGVSRRKKGDITKRAFAEDQFMDDSLIPQKTWYKSKCTET